ncbi:MAG: cytidine deaminase [Paludibacteraceae bacterium]|nr:cytidine deaminase [Paludibacteraceae bacterium]
MDAKEIICRVEVLSWNELNEQERRLIDEAKRATEGSYSPYSKFAVGAALLLENGVVVRGSNQENVSYPCGLCAERTALYYANATYPDQPVRLLAIAARNAEGFLSSPITPCGACRQSLLETENRFGKPISVLLYGEQKIYRLRSIASLLPLQFEM